MSEKSYAQEQLDVLRSLRAPEGGLVEIVWLDPTAHQDTEETDWGQETDLKKLLTICHSYGRIVTEDEDVVVLGQHENENGDFEYIAIHKGLIRERREYQFKDSYRGGA